MFMKSESGQGLVEYALIIAMVALVVIVVLALVGPALSDYYNYAITNIHAFTGQ